MDTDAKGRFQNGNKQFTKQKRDSLGHFLSAKAPLGNGSDRKKFSKKEVESAIKLIENSGYFVTKTPLQQGYTFDLDIDPVKGKTYKIGCVSDTHLGSKYQQLKSLHRFYKHCADEGITTILHAGDICDGMFVYKGHEFEVFRHGADEICEYVCQNYPDYGITTELLCGNHDESLYRRSGMDIGEAISNKRKDIIHRGFHSANFLVGDLKIALHHGIGGTAYARSYKCQKLAEAHVEDDPAEAARIIILGHYHCSCILPDYMKFFMVQMGCFQAQTSLGRRLGRIPDIAGIILEFKGGRSFSVPKCTYLKYDSVKEDY